MKSVIILEDGKIFTGTSFGYTGVLHATGEGVFNTSMTGYQEILTDLLSKFRNIGIEMHMDR